MKKRLRLLLCICLSVSFYQCTDQMPSEVLPKNDTNVSSASLKSASAKDGMTLLFEDHFDGTELDYTKWKRATAYRENKVHDVVWRPGNIRVINGMLDITIQNSGKFNSNGKAIINAGAIRSDGKFNSSHGYYEARIKIFKGSPGLSGAFWLMSSKVGNENNSGRDGAEIDIVEMPWNTGRTVHTVHWDGYGEMHKSAHHEVPPNNSRQPGTWHTFGLKWTPTEYTFYIDDVKTWTSKAGGVSQAKDAYMILSANVLAPWGLPSGQSFNVESLPNHLKVDWVKVYGFTADNLFDHSIVPDSDMENESWVLKNSKDTKAFMNFVNWTKVSGKKCMKVWVKTADAKAPSKIKTEKNINLKSNTNYRLNFYAKAKMDKAKLTCVYATEAEYVENKFVVATEKKDIILGAEWEEYSIEFRTKDVSNALDHTTLRFLFPNAGVYFLDNINITEL